MSASVLEAPGAVSAFVNSDLADVTPGLLTAAETNTPALCTPTVVVACPEEVALAAAGLNATAAVVNALNG